MTPHTPRRKYVISAALLLIAAVASAGTDTVILNDGRSYTGRVLEQGETVRIEMSYGTIEVSADDVAYIVPAEQADETDEVDDDGDLGEQVEVEADLADSDSGFSLADATRPEPVVFMLMRNLADMPPGTESYQLRQDIRRFQILAHERRRKVGGQWRPPEYFKRARVAFAEAIEEADELRRSAERVRGDDPADRNRRRRLEQQAAARYRAAARQWADPLLRQFLMGAAELYAGNYHRAEGFFRSCVAEAPQVAGFHQGHSIALGELGRHGDALSAAMVALRLRPESPQALALVVDAMEGIPGAETDRPPYSDARELLRDYSDVDETVRRSRRDRRWLMPGLRRRWGVSDAQTLPDMPYDRLCLRQAVAAPVHEHFLVVDADVVEDAYDVLVMLEDGTMLPAEVERVRTFGRDGPLPPLRLVSVPDASFTPLDIADAPPTGTDLTVRTAPVYARMGSRIRRFDTRLESDGDDWTPTRPLVAGLSASPVLTPDGAIAGVLAAKTDPAEAGGGPDAFIPPAEVRRLVDDSRLRIGRGGFSFGADYAERTSEPRPAEGQAFLVIAVFGETFE